MRLPGIYVDVLVESPPEDYMQTFGTQYDPAFSGEIRTPLNALSRCRWVRGRSLPGGQPWN